MPFERHLSHDRSEANDHQTQVKSPERRSKQGTGEYDYGPSWSGGEYSGRNPFAVSESTTQSSGRGEELLEHDEHPSMWQGEGESSGGGWTDKAGEMTNILQEWDKVYKDVCDIKEYYNNLSFLQRWTHSAAYKAYESNIHKYVDCHEKFSAGNVGIDSVRDIIDKSHNENDAIVKKLVPILKLDALDKYKSAFEKLKSANAPNIIKKQMYHLLSVGLQDYYYKNEESTRTRKTMRPVIDEVFAYGKEHGFPTPYF